MVFARVVGVFAVGVVVSMAQDSKVIVHTAERLTELNKALVARVSGNKPSFTVLRRTPNTTSAVIYRALTGEAELHEEFSDVFVIQSGTATLVFGGTLQEPRTVGPGETAAKSIVGGERRKLAPGDVVHIPAKLPHWVVLEPGDTVTYLILKVKD